VKRIEEDEELTEMRCRTCGTLLGYRRRLGPFVFWCSETCADTVMPKHERDVVMDEVALELYLSGVGMVATAKFLDVNYTRVQQSLYRRGITLSRPAKSA
jgi:hypothetical protein